MIKIAEPTIYLVGNPKVDGEHLELINLINLINAYSLREDLKKEVPALIIQFSDKLFSHCTQEEDELTQAGCPNIQEHKDEHGRFIDAMLAYLGSMKWDGELVHVFEDMLRSHIIEFDIPSFRCEDTNEFQEKKD